MNSEIDLQNNITSSLIIRNGCCTNSSLTFQIMGTDKILKCGKCNRDLVQIIYKVNDPAEIIFNKVADEFGWLSNMSAYPILYKELRCKTTEALFQSRRFSEFPKIQDEIRKCQSPMGAKMVARRERKLLNRYSMWDYAEGDYKLMKECLMLKLEQHPELKSKLMKTGDAIIIEDCTTHDREAARIWGCVKKNGEWVGQNIFGKIWMEIRSELQNKTDNTSEEV